MIAALLMTALFVAVFVSGYKFGREMLRLDIRVARNRGEDLSRYLAPRP